MEKNSYESILRDVKARKFSPVYFFCGEEAYFIDALTEQMEKYALNEMEKAFNQTVVYGKDVSARQIAETCGRLPMMAERQVVIIKEAQGISLKEEEEAQYLAYLKKPVASTILVFAWKHGTPDGRKSFTKEIKKSAVYFESKRLYENQVAAWVKKAVKERNHSIGDAAAELIVEYTGNHLSKITNELEKLMLNKPSGSVINEDDIEKLIGISKEFNVFELNNAIGAGHTAQAYRIVNYFRANPKNGPLALVLGALYGFFTKVYQLHFLRGKADKDMAAAIKVSSFFIEDYKTAAGNFSPKKIEEIFYLLEEYDLRYKGVGNQGVEEGELLREMVYKIMAR